MGATARPSSGCGLARVLASAALIALGALAPARADDDPVVARVNGAEIRRSALNERIKVLGGEGGQVERLVIEGLILDEILRQRMTAANVEVSDAEYDAVIAQTWERIKETEGEGASGFDSLEAFLTARGVPPERYRDSLRLQAQVKSYLERSARQAPGVVAGGLVRSALAGSPAAEDAVLRAWLAKHEDFFGDAQVRASTILVAITKERGPAEARAAEKLRAEATADGADFAALAVKHSNEPAAVFTGGDLNFFPRHGAIPEPIARAAFALKVGEVSDPIRVARGFALIKATDRRDGAALRLADVRERVANHWLGDAVRRTIERWRREAKVELVKAAPPGKD